MKSFITEFKEFINRGNLLALATAFVIGAAVTAMVNALVTNVIMPIVAIPFGEANFDTALIATLNGAEIRFGAFLTAVVNFVLIALAVFWMMKGYNRMMRGIAGPQDAPDEEAPSPTETELLGELIAEVRGLRRDMSAGGGSSS